MARRETRQDMAVETALALGLGVERESGFCAVD